MIFPQCIVNESIQGAVDLQAHIETVGSNSKDILKEAEKRGLKRSTPEVRR